MRNEREVAFVLGAIFGSLATLLIEKAYKKTDIPVSEVKEVKQESNPTRKALSDEGVKKANEESKAYHEMAVSYVTPSDAEKEMLKKYDKKPLTAEKADVPYCITRDDFDDHNGYTKMEGCTFYSGDEILADFCDEKLDIGTVGFEALGQFGTNLEDPDIIYVRNDESMIDFEIIRSPNTWAETVGEV